jgi:hypothetical protein
LNPKSCPNFGEERRPAPTYVKNNVSYFTNYRKDERLRSHAPNSPKHHTPTLSHSAQRNPPIAMSSYARRQPSKSLDCRRGPCSDPSRLPTLFRLVKTGLRFLDLSSLSSLHRLSERHEPSAIFSSRLLQY